MTEAARVPPTPPEWHVVAVAALGIKVRVDAESARYFYVQLGDDPDDIVTYGSRDFKRREDAEAVCDALNDVSGGASPTPRERNELADGLARLWRDSDDAYVTAFTSCAECGPPDPVTPEVVHRCSEHRKVTAWRWAWMVSQGVTVGASPTLREWGVVGDGQGNYGVTGDCVRAVMFSTRADAESALSLVRTVLARGALGRAGGDR